MTSFIVGVFPSADPLTTYTPPWDAEDSFMVLAPCMASAVVAVIETMIDDMPALFGDALVNHTFARTRRCSNGCCEAAGQYVAELYGVPFYFAVAESSLEVWPMLESDIDA